MYKERALPFDMVVTATQRVLSQAPIWAYIRKIETDI